MNWDMSGVDCGLSSIHREQLCGLRHVHTGQFMLVFFLVDIGNRECGLGHIGLMMVRHLVWWLYGLHSE